jgi:L-ribulose-5-phosphate 4-epimerase
MGAYAELKEQAWKANLQLPASGLVTGTFGNASAFDRARGVFAIKPSGVPFEVLKADDLVIVDLAGKVVEGKMRPSSDTKTHAVLYNAWNDIGGIVHTHSAHAVSWAQAKSPIPVFGTTHADAMAQDVPLTDVLTDEMIRGDYETETGNQILKRFESLSHTEVEMVLVASHGPFTWGASPAKAVDNSAMLELIARTALMTLQINPQATRLNQALLRKHYERKHGPDKYYGQY